MKLFKGNKIIKTVALALVLAGLTAQQSKADDIIKINGAGATFPYPLYSKWFYEYNKLHPGIQFNYQSIGSGGGIQQITAKTVDFGASDAPMKDEEIAAAGDIMHIPAILGSVVVAYNNPAVGDDFKLNGAVLAEIFLGKITKWNDAKIAALNTGKTLPSDDILVVHRSDGSGTSYVFTDYLSKVSGEWKAKVGTNKSVSWPTGLGAKGNEGVTGLVKQTPGSIGYIELGFAVQNKLPMASIQNKAGQYVKASPESISAAASQAKLPSDYRASITNADGAAAYPISAFTYLLVYKTQKDAVKGKALVDFLKWAMKDGQTMAASLYYAPLPPTLVAKIDGTTNSIALAK